MILRKKTRWKLGEIFGTISSTMKYAVIETGGKQYKVTSGMELEVENLNVSKDADIFFDKVLMIVEDDKLELGTPYLPNIKISATVVDSLKGEKIRVAKFRSKSRHRRVMGHRQLLSKVKIGELKKEAKKEVNKK